MDKITELLNASLETYTEIQAQQAFDLANAARRVLRSEEIYTTERLGEGRIQLRALENKVMEVKNRLRLADLQLRFLREKLVGLGFVVRDNAPLDFAEILQKKPLHHAPPITASELAQISAPQPEFDDPPTSVTDLILEEPITRPDVYSWARATLSGEPEVNILGVDNHEGNAGADSGSKVASGSSRLLPGKTRHIVREPRMKLIEFLD